MSKELIEQLAKDLFHNVSVIEKWVAKGSPDRFGKVNGERKHILTFEATLEELEAFAKAYQAAAPIDNGYTPNNFFNWLDAYCLGMVITQQSLRDEYTKMLSCPDAAPIDNVAEALEKAAKAIDDFASSGENKDDWTITRDLAFYRAAEVVRALIPTQATPIAVDADAERK
jgi:hypothetical protein